MPFRGLLLSWVLDLMVGEGDELYFGFVKSERRGKATLDGSFGPVGIAVVPHYQDYEGGVWGEAGPIPTFAEDYVESYFYFS